MKLRLQRFLADCGVASRRECEQLIAAGRVRVNGEIRNELPVFIDPASDIITFDDEKIAPGAAALDPAAPLKEQPKVYFLLNKPKGILVTTYDPSDRKTVGELMTGRKERVFPVGRLDMDARGALIMTNDGELANRLTHPRYGVDKTYIVEVDGRVGHAEIEKVKRGIWLGPARPGPYSPRLAGDTASPARRPRESAGARHAPGRPAPTPNLASKTEHLNIQVLGRERGRTILEVNTRGRGEAKNRDLRRIMAGIGHVVRDMNRVAIAGKITLDNLKIGAFRPLTEKEVQWLYRASSPDFHQEKRTAAQAWFEAKEMEKERKRLAAQTPPASPGTTSRAQKTADPTASPPAKPFRERPTRKGKKPFVPPTGRNAGKPLGGNFIGRKLHQQRQRRETLADDMPDQTESLSPTPSTPPLAHPLGDSARSDE